MKRGIMKKLLLLAPLVVLVFFVAIPQASAFTTESGSNVTVSPTDSVSGDYYVAAGNCTMEGTIRGDLVVTGGTVRILGTVEGELLAMAGSVEIQGTIKGTVRILAGIVQLGEKAHLERDLVLGGGSLETMAGSQVAGTVVVGCSQALLAGDIGEDLTFSGNRLTLRGTVARDAKVFVEGEDRGENMSPWWTSWLPNMPQWPSLAPGLSISDNAKVIGTLDYTSSRQFDIPSGAAGKVQFHQQEAAPSTDRPSSLLTSQPQTFGGWLWNTFRLWIGAVVAGLIILWLFRGFLKRGMEAVTKRPFPALGWGVVWVLAIPIGLILLIILAGLLAMLLGLITFGELAGVVILLAGVAVTVGAAFLWIYLRFVAPAVVGYALGRVILKAITRKEPAPALAMILGLVILVLLFGIPVVGWIIELLVSLLGLGALWLGRCKCLPSKQALPSTAGSQP